MLASYSIDYICDLVWLIIVITTAVDVWWWCLVFNYSTRKLYQRSRIERRKALREVWFDTYTATVLLTMFALVLSYALFIQTPIIITRVYVPSLLHEMGLLISAWVILGLACIHAKSIQIDYNKWPPLSKIFHKLCGVVALKGDTNAKT